MPPEERWQPAVREKRYRQRKNKKPRLVSEGDSWFDYPPHPNVIDYIDDEELYAIKRFESSGDTLHSIVERIDGVVAALESERPRCLLFSGGGNDVLQQGFISHLFREFDPNLTPREHLQPVWNEKLKKLEVDYVLLMNKVGAFGPIVIHGYDYMPPNNKGAKYDGFRLAGPWVLPEMRAKHITDQAFQRAIMREVIDDFNKILVRLQTQFPLHFIHIDLRGTFAPADWINEIHLNKAGFHRVADRFLDALDTRLPQVLENRRALGVDT